MQITSLLRLFLFHAPRNFGGSRGQHPFDTGSTAVVLPWSVFVEQHPRQVQGTELLLIEIFLDVLMD